VGPASLLATAGGTSQTFTNTLTGTGQQWQQFTLHFTATGAITPISFQGISTAGGAYLGLDNVSIVDAIPEPASLSLLMLTLPALLRRSTRRR
jgi:hypothetical protein